MVIIDNSGYALGQIELLVEGSVSRRLAESQNIFIPYGGNPSEITRGSFRPIDYLYDQATGTVTATYDFYEPLLVSPFTSKLDQPGLTQIDSCDFTIVFDNNLKRC